MQLREGQAEEFHRRHDPVWPQLQALLEDEGVSNFSIFLHPQTHQLFAYAEIASEERWDVITRAEVYRDWWASLRELVDVAEDNTPVATELRELFYLP